MDDLLPPECPSPLQVLPDAHSENVHLMRIVSQNLLLLYDHRPQEVQLSPHRPLKH